MSTNDCFIYRHQWTRVQPYVPREALFPIPDGCTWSGKRLTRKQTTSRPNSLWPDIWKHMSDARKLRGVYFIDPAYEEFKEIFYNARGKLEVPMPAALPCRTRREEYSETWSVLDNCNVKYAYSVRKGTLIKIMEVILQCEELIHWTNH